jgi:hypothetical protein
MIVAARKPFEEILDILGDAERILVSACNTCVTVCLVGGRREAALLASQLRIHAQEAGREIEVRESALERHCDREFLDALTEDLEWADVMLSTACGVGVNLVADVNPTRRIVPALNTTFFGATDLPGRWREMCGGCGDCVLHKTGGICPVVRCAKSILNGPCGGCQDGKCEVDKDTTCAWQDIIERLDGQGRSPELEVFEPIKDWRASHAGGRRRRIVEEVFAGDAEVSA